MHKALRGNPQSLGHRNKGPDWQLAPAKGSHQLVRGHGASGWCGQDKTQCPTTAYENNTRALSPSSLAHGQSFVSTQGTMILITRDRNYNITGENKISIS